MASAIVNYQQTKTYACSLDIPDIGDCALRCTSADFEDYYLVVQTIMGKSFILTFGPVIADVYALEDNFALFYRKMDYKEAQIIKAINNLVNDAHKNINEVELIEPKDAFAALPTADKFIPV